MLASVLQGGYSDAGLILGVDPNLLLHVERRRVSGFRGELGVGCMRTHVAEPGDWVGNSVAVGLCSWNRSTDDAGQIWIRNRCCLNWQRNRQVERTKLLKINDAEIQSEMRLPSPEKWFEHWNRSPRVVQDHGKPGSRASLGRDLAELSALGPAANQGS